MLSRRVASAAVLIPIIVAAVYVGGACLGALVLVAVGLATNELVSLLQQHDLRPSRLAALPIALLLAADGSWPELQLLEPVLVLLTLIPASIAVFQRNEPGSLESWAMLTAGALYVGYGASHVGRLRTVPNGFAWLATALVGTWICDTAAYAVGMHLGKRRLAPKVSPNKSWEGALGGLGGALLVSMVAGPLFLQIGVGWSILLGVLIATAATLGDLAESVIKRQVGVKDSGNLIPGHGGMLDRIDSLLFVVPLVYWYQVALQSLELLC
ncbi:MAG: phosphatidate cytidylyltransferase [Anaerolineae bacterium]